MPEEILETPQPQPEDGRPLDDGRNWPKIILAAVLGLGLLAAGAYSGYYYGTLTPVVSQTTPAPTVDWETYTDESVSFRYPQDWVVGSPQVFGSRSELDFKYNLTTVLALSMVANYNNSTGEPFATLNEFLGNRDSDTKEINVGGYQAKRITSPGEAGHVIPYEEVVLFTPDKSFIVSLYYQASYYEKPEASRVLDQILSTFKLLN